VIIHNADIQIQRGGITGERQFGISMNQKMYSLLSDKLYTDRVGSVVREVCSNAWDAQKMKSMASGNPVESFVISLPTSLSPHFIVQDTGPGMPDDVAQNLYSTLGLSTKENSNDQIGAFGLGSKSPFAVTDTFTIENTYEGTTHYYMCFKSEAGLPSLLKTGEKVEDRPNGVKVVIPAPGYKYAEYASAVMRQLVIMEPKPIVENIDNFSYIEPEISMENEFGYILHNATSFGLRSRSVYARMGMVLYPIDTSLVLSMYRNIHGGMSNTTSLIIKFNIGDIEPLPSREGLTYDKYTIANITSAYDSFAEGFTERLIASVNEIKLPLDAFAEIKCVRDTIGIDLMRSNIYIRGWPINGKAIPHVFPRFDHTHLVPSTTLFEPDGITPIFSKLVEKQSVFLAEAYLRSDTRLNIKRNQESLDSFHFSRLLNIKNEYIKFLLIDELEPKYRVSRLKSVLNDIDYNTTYLFIRVNPNFAGSKIDFSGFINSLENIHPGITEGFKYLSQIEKPVVEKTVRSTDEITIDGLAVRKPYSSYDVHMKQSEFDALVNGDDDVHRIDFEGNAFYITATRNTLNEYPNLDLTHFFNAFGKRQYIFIVRKSGMHKITMLEAAGILEFKDYINAKMNSAVLSDDFYKRQSANEIYTEQLLWSRYTHSSHLRHLTSELTQQSAFIHPCIKMWSDIDRLQNALYNVDADETLFTTLRDYDMLEYFVDKDWANRSNIDLKADFDASLVELNKFYPSFNDILSASGYNVEPSVKLNQYVLDYNTLRGK
jgi:hypothetical protein